MMEETSVTFTTQTNENSCHSMRVPFTCNQFNGAKAHIYVLLVLFRERTHGYLCYMREVTIYLTARI